MKKLAMSCMSTAKSVPYLYGIQGLSGSQSAYLFSLPISHLLTSRLHWISCNSWNISYSLSLQCLCTCSDMGVEGTHAHAHMYTHTGTDIWHAAAAIFYLSTYLCFYVSLCVSPTLVKNLRAGLCLTHLSRGSGHACWINEWMGGWMDGYMDR